MHKRGIVFSVAMALLLWLAPGAAQARPHHEGFTGDLGLGLAYSFVPVNSVNVSCSSTIGCSETSTTTHEGKFGLAPLSLSLGGYVTPEVAILGRAAGTSYFRNGDQISNNFYGAIVEVWPMDALYVSGGIGFGLYGGNPIFNRNATQTGGWALDFRVGAALAQGTNHDFTLSLEAIPGFYEGNNVIGSALVGAWKWY